MCLIPVGCDITIRLGEPAGINSGSITASYCALFIFLFWLGERLGDYVKTSSKSTEDESP